MKYKTINCGNVFTILTEEYFNTPPESYIKVNDGKFAWENFIESKDLGIKAVGLSNDYIIVDEKKWTISKLKYGF
jgi:hypothetical protein